VSAVKSSIRVSCGAGTQPARWSSVQPPSRPRACRSEKLPEQPAQPSGDTDEGAGPDRRARPFPDRVAVRVEHEADAGRNGWTVDVIRKPTDTGRTAAADWQVENLLGDFRHAVEDRAAASQHDP